METFVVSVYNEDSGMSEPAKIFHTKGKAIRYIIKREGINMDSEEIDDLYQDLIKNNEVTSYDHEIENSYFISRMILSDDD